MFIRSTELIKLLSSMVKEACDGWEEALKGHDFTEVEKWRAKTKALQEVMNKVLEMDKEEIK